MNQQEKHEQFQTAMKVRFPTMVGVVSLGSDTSKAMKEEREALRKQALSDRATRRKR